MFIREDIRDNGTLLVFDSSYSVHDLIDSVREVDPSALMACADGFENAIWLPHAIHGGAYRNSPVGIFEGYGEYDHA